MRRLRNDLPYRFLPPEERAWFRGLGMALNRWYFLKRFYRVDRVETEGWEGLAEKVRQGHSLLLAPNHTDHADPHVMMEVGERHGLRLKFMAAREVFEVSAAARWALQSLGVFSVDRDGPDLASLKTAIGMVEKGQSLVIYPEGEIYHHHERLDPLHEGVASILLKGAGRLAEGKEAYLVPVGIRFYHDSKVEATFRDRLTKLEDRIGWVPKPERSVDERILRLGAGILALKETEYFGEAGRGEIQERLATMCEKLLGEVEERQGKDGRATTAPERVRALRYRLRRRLLDAASPPSVREREVLLDDLDRVFVALQAHSYIGDYLLGDDPGLDRRAETVMKLEEDLLGFPQYPVGRRVKVVAGEPFEVRRMLRDGELSAKGAGELTVMLERRLREMLVRLGCEQD